MAAPLSNFAKVYINGDFIGLYSNTESITKKFVNKHFFSNQNTFFKCNPVSSTNGKCNLLYLGTDSSLYYNSYELKSDAGWNELINLCDTLKNHTSSVNSILDIDRVLWMLAFDNLSVNLDSYIGGITQNYYLYRSGNGSFNVILWDLNEAFGCFDNTGEGAPLNLTQMQQMSPWLHLTNNNWPLIQKLLNNPLFKKKYIAHYISIFNDFFVNDQYLSIADTLRNLIDASVLADTNKMYTYAQFQNGMTSNITTGMMVPGIKVLMDLRKVYLSNLTEFQYLKPQISMPIISDTIPNLNDTVDITVQVQNANMVQLGYRSSESERFVLMQMFDDGQHNDGISGDGIFGIKMPILSSSTQYYFYADNINAGTFLPEKAEYEYFVLNANIQQISSGELVINEFMAINNTTIANNNNQYCDWIELYNNTANILCLNNLYVSDDINNPLKWKLPDNISIQAYGYLLIWANDDTTANDLYANFKLSGSGDHLILSYSNGSIVDSLSFFQQSADISYGRYPNGTGSFTSMPPSPLSANQLSTINKISVNNFNIFPNPMSDFLNISSLINIETIEVYDLFGKCLINVSLNPSNLCVLSTSSLPCGVYFLKLNKQYIFKLVK